MQPQQKDAQESAGQRRGPGRYTHRIEGRIHAANGDSGHFVAMKAGEFEPQDLSWILRNCTVKSDYLISKI